MRLSKQTSFLNRSPTGTATEISQTNTQWKTAINGSVGFDAAVQTVMQIMCFAKREQPKMSGIL